MKSLLTSAILALGLSMGATQAAQASGGESSVRVWSDGTGGVIRTPDRAEAPRRTRLAYANPREDWDEGDVRPRRRSYEPGERQSRRQATQQRSKRVAKTRRHRHVAKRPAARTRQAAIAVAPQRRADRPAYTRRSLSTAGPVAGTHHGIASFYWQPQRVAAGGWFNPNAMTAAHKTLPFGTRVRVTHLGNGRSVEVKINDRGPYIAGRIIDLSKAAAGIIGMTAQGIAKIKMEILGR